MSLDQERSIRIVVHPSSPDTARLEGNVCLPSGAEFPEFIDALRTQAPAIYEEVRRRVLRAAGRVLAYGRDEPLLMAIDEKLAEGGTLVFPPEEEERTVLTIDPPQHLN